MIKKYPWVELGDARFIRYLFPEANDVFSFDRFFYNETDYPEMFKELDKIRQFLRDKYRLGDIKIWDCRYIKDLKYVGDEYIFNGNDSDIQGKISIVNSILKTRDEKGYTNIKQWIPGNSYYIFKTNITNDDDYNSFCRKLIKLSIELDLKLVKTLEPSHKYAQRQDICYDPVFVREDNGLITLEKFQNFMKKMELISREYILYFHDRMIHTSLLK
jgi:hypothetical protein